MEEKERLDVGENPQLHMLQWYASAVIVLDASVLYLESFEDLYWKLQDAVEELAKQYREETPEGKQKLAPRIRRAIRRIEGKVSDSFSPVLDDNARKTFMDAWDKLNREERIKIAETYEYNRVSGIPTVTLRKNARSLVEEVVAKTLDKNIGVVERAFYEAIADDPEYAYVANEYVEAIDDLLDADADETLRWRAAFKRETERVFKSTLEKERREKEKFSAIGAIFSSAENSGADEPLASDESRAEQKNDEADAVADGARTPYSPNDYYPIDEKAAALAKRAVSFDAYEPNSATRAYRAEVDSARKLAEERKKKVGSRYFDRISRLLDSYERRLANWLDRRNTVEGSYPSVLISGAGNYSESKHAKKMERLEELYKERDEIREILSKIEGVGTGGISSDDADAIEKLQDKLERLKEAHEEMKRANLYLRINGSWDGYDRPDLVKDAFDGNGRPTFFYLSNTLAEIKRVERRLDTLKRSADTDYGDGWPFKGGIAKVNKEENRLQLFFDEKPDAETLAKLKGRGFHWSPRNSAWQRMLTPDALWTAKFLGYIPRDWKPCVRRDKSATDNEDRD